MKDVKKQIETLFAMAKERGFSPMWTHFYRYFETCSGEGLKELGATACILLDADQNVISRGMTVVSLNDIGDKTYGRLRSLKRAFDAAVSKADVEEVGFQFPEDLDPTFSLREVQECCLVKATRANAKACLSNVETDRIKAKKERIAARKAEEEKAIVAAAKKAVATAKKTPTRKSKTAATAG